MTPVLSALAIGVIEGVTEWLPVSSTGHMLLFDRFFGLSRAVPEEFYAFFLVAVQLGAIAAVVWLYFDQLNPFSRRKTREERKSTFRLWGNVAIATVPAVAAGFFLDDLIEKRLSSPVVIAAALIGYGILFLFLDRRRRPVRVEDTGEITGKDAFTVGLFQVLSLVPGTSRSGATITGGVLSGLSLPAAAEFSFFMAIPVMAGASLLRGVKFAASGVRIGGEEWCILLTGAIAAFAVSLLTVRFLTGFVKKHGFTVFGWYRILLGLAVILCTVFS